MYYVPYCLDFYILRVRLSLHTIIHAFSIFCTTFQRLVVVHSEITFLDSVDESLCHRPRTSFGEDELHRLHWATNGRLLYDCIVRRHGGESVRPTRHLLPGDAGGEAVLESQGD